MRKMIAVMALTYGLLACSEAAEKTQDKQPIADYFAQVILEGLDKPWSIALLPKHQALITEKTGSVVRVDLKTGKKIASITGIPQSSVHGQGGLLDIAIDANFEKVPYVYLSYVRGDGKRFGVEAGRGLLKGDRLEQFETFFVAKPKGDDGRHFGSRLVLADDDYVFITLGDRGVRKDAQDLGSHSGSIIRLHKDGRIPVDNPFVKTSGALPEIYSYGHRNVQGAALHPVTRQLWAHEHGPQGGDEVNLIRAGANYGWPVITYGREYGTAFKIGEGTEKEGIEQPAWQWTPSIAPAGMVFYQGDEIKAWENKLLVGSLKFQLLSQLSVDNENVKEESRHFEQTYGRIRDVRASIDGMVYLITDSGKLVKVSKAR